MSIKTEFVHPDRLDTSLLDGVLFVQKTLIAIAVLVSGLGLLASAFLLLRHAVPAWAVMSPSAALVTFACSGTLAILLSPSGRPLGEIRHWIPAVAVVTGIAGWVSAGGYSALPRIFSLTDPSAVRPGEMTIQVATAFLLLALVLVFLDIRRGIASYAADALLSLLILLTLFLAARYLFQVTSLFGVSALDPTPLATLVALFLLTIAVFLTRARHGFFDVLLGGGFGGKLSRPVAILIMVMPFSREALRERLIRVHLIPEHGAAAFLAALTSLLGLVFITLISRSMRRMENSIRNLSLRDELTGLYNLRGFKLLAEHAIHMAQRSQLPFSLLFIDVDDLKQINDTMGHGVGSAILAETAELLKTNFRQADVVGRVGGDEFAVAGQFTENEVLQAVEQLESQALLTRTGTGQILPISLSIGHVTATVLGEQSLQQLLDEADAVMYHRKRRKKLQVC